MASNEAAAPGNAGPITAKPTLGLTGLTMNAMALIAPGAFLWLTFQMQSLYGAPMAGSAMWFGILGALLLASPRRSATPSCRSFIPAPAPRTCSGAGVPLQEHAFKFARIAKFVTGWASHLYYWVYPGLHGRRDRAPLGYLLNQFFPDTFSGTYNSPLFMVAFLHRLRPRCGLHRVPRRDRHHRRQRGDQYRPDLGAVGLLRDGHRLPGPAPQGSQAYHLSTALP